MENRFRYRKIRVRQSRTRIFLQFEKDENSSFSSLLSLFADLKHTRAAPQADAGRMADAQQTIHFRRDGRIEPCRMVHQHIIRRLDLPGGQSAELPHGRRQREHPDGRADGHMVVGGQVNVKRLDGHGPAVHREPPAPPEARRALGALRRFDLIDLRAGAVGGLLCLPFHITHTHCL